MARRRNRLARILFVAFVSLVGLGLMGFAKPPSGGSTVGVSTGPVSAVPEPTGFLVFALGAGIVGLVVHRRGRNSQ